MLFQIPEAELRPEGAPETIPYAEAAEKPEDPRKKQSSLYQPSAPLVLEPPDFFFALSGLRKPQAEQSPEWCVATVFVSNELLFF